MSDRKNIHVGKKMDEILKKSSFSVGDISLVLDITRGTWNNIRKAELPKLEYVKTFCETLEVDFDKEFGSEYEEELTKLSIVQEAQEPYGNSKLKELSEELHTAYRKLTLSYEREMKMMRLLAQNQISIPE